MIRGSLQVYANYDFLWKSIRIFILTFLIPMSKAETSKRIDNFFIRPLDRNEKSRIHF
jgi:hypothetical protein